MDSSARSGSRSPSVDSSHWPPGPGNRLIESLGRSPRAPRPILVHTHQARRRAITTEPTAPQPSAAASAELEAIEALAVVLAREAGEQARQSLARAITVDYKPDASGKDSTSDPVSEVDRAVEALVRERVGARFPGHGVIGEEVEEAPAADAEYVWAIDPIDGTANFVNGFPLFAVSIGVLHHGRPVVGAVWCASTHALHPGVYHAHEGGTLRLDGGEVPAERATAVRRRLAAAPGGAPGGTKEWDHRVTGSIAIETAFVAAGVFAAATFWAPRLWDVAAGVVLVRASGREVWIRQRDSWSPLDRFEAPAELPRRRGSAGNGAEPARPPTLRDWRQPILVGAADATALIRARATSRGLAAGAWRLARRIRRLLP